jgi:hypothetical protein
VVITDIAIDVPDGWEQRTDLPDVALLARPLGRPTQPAPTLNVTAAHHDGSPTFDVYVQAQLTGLAATVDGTLVSCETTSGSPADPLHTLELAFAYDLLGNDLTCVQRHLVDGDGRAVIATATAADADWPGTAATLVAAVRSIRVTRA